MPSAPALEISLDELVSSQGDEDVVIRPRPAHRANVTTWLLSRDRAAAAVAVVKTRLGAGASPATQRQVHPGWEWFTVLTGRARPGLRDLEILPIFNRDGERAHLNYV